LPDADNAPDGAIRVWKRDIDPAESAVRAALRDASFRTYADYMTSDRAFETALDEVLAEAGQQITAIMCSEALYWRCHRRLISDARSCCGRPTCSTSATTGDSPRTC
jgi:uncharacterized protein (DUF488 family)